MPQSNRKRKSNSRKKGKRRPRTNKRRSSGRRASRKRNTSQTNTKMTWEQFLKHKDSRKVLQEAWKHKNPQKHFGQTVKRLHRKYSSNKKR